MARRITLNTVYKAINMALDINQKLQQQVFRLAGIATSNSLVNGFWRPPEDNRFRYVTHTLLMEYCIALASHKHILASKIQRDLSASDTHQDLIASDVQRDLIVKKLQDISETLKKREMIDEYDIDEWEELSISLGNGPIWQKISTQKAKIR